MSEMASMQMKDWVQLIPRLAILALIVSAPAIIGFIVMRRGRSRVYFILGLACSLLLLAIALPSVVPARPIAERNSCIAYLKILADAKRSWAGETKQTPTAVPSSSDLLPHLHNGFMPTCPGGGAYTFGTVNEAPRCSLHALGHALESGYSNGR